MRITFNKASVILMYANIIALPVISIIMKEWPPAEFIYCWIGFWLGQGILTAHLRENKRAVEHRKDVWSELARYLTDDNAQAIVEHYMGVELEPKKAERKGSKK